MTARAAALAEAKGCEFADRVVILGTRALLLETAGRTQEARALVVDLRRRMRQENARIRNEVTRRRHRVATTRLLQAVLSTEGLVYPRVRFQQSTEGLLADD